MESFVSPRVELEAQRASATERRQRRRGKLLVLAFVIVIIVVTIAGFWIGWASRPDDPVRMLTDQGAEHVSEPMPDYVYNTLPPASGPHVPELAAWGEHTDPIPNWIQLHNLEVGGVIMHYDCPAGCPEIVSELRGILDEQGTDRLILEPYPDMEHRIVLTAWSHWLALDEVDRAAIVNFIERFRGVGYQS